MVAFGEALPKLRRKLKRDLGLPGLPREKVLAVVVSILDATRVRIGNTEYARDNKSFGLTTLRNRHVSFIRDGRAMLNFRGKGGVPHEMHIDDRRIAQIVRHCQEIPGQHLFQYVSDDGQRCPIDSGQVNDYLREAMGDDFTAKDFRTWGATLHAITLLACTPLPEPAERAGTQKRNCRRGQASGRQAAQHAGRLPQSPISIPRSSTPGAKASSMRSSTAVSISPHPARPRPWCWRFCATKPSWRPPASRTLTIRLSAGARETTQRLSMQIRRVPRTRTEPSTESGPWVPIRPCP